MMRGVRALVIACALGGLASCAGVEPLVARAAPEGERVALREETRRVAEPACGSCHRSSVPTHKLAALAIFDLDVEDWSAHMKPMQLQVFLARIERSLDERSRPRVRAFLEGELAAR